LAWCKQKFEKKRENGFPDLPSPWAAGLCTFSMEKVEGPPTFFLPPVGHNEFAGALRWARPWKDMEHLGVE
jgi:hypothetical protein